MPGTRMFSENWYRVAPLRVALRTGVQTRRQRFHGETWRVLHDPYAHQFFRLRPAAYRFIARLRPDRTVEEVWRETLDRTPDEAPGQEEVIRLLAQLYQSNLLQLDLPPDAEQFFKRYHKRKQQEHKSFWMHIMFARFPLLDPTPLLKAMHPYARWMFSRAGLALWLVTMLVAGKVALGHADRIVDQSQGILAPGNLFLLYLGLALIKAIHEFGHAFALRRFDGEVHTMGILLMIFTPIPYIDATASWALRRRRDRILVAASGMMVELFVACIALFIWASTGPGVLNALCYNMMFIASVSTLLFNGNPLLRYDGYYILSDTLDIPNLFMRSTQQLRYLAEGRLLGRRNVQPAAQSPTEAFWLVLYGILSGLYRVFVFSAIILFVSRRFLLAGMIMATICAVTWILVPAGKFIHYLLTDPALDRTRGRAIGVSLAGAAVLALLAGVVPFPSSFSAPGVLHARVFAEVSADTSGFLREFPIPSGSPVRPGEPLLLIDDPEWPHIRQIEQFNLEHLNALYRRAQHQSTADLAPVAAHQRHVRQRLDHLDSQRDAWQVRAPVEGIWVASVQPDMAGIRVHRGIALGYIVQPGEYLFVCVVSQDEADWLFDERALRRGRVRLKGGATYPWEVRQWHVIPGDQRRLPSPALGWYGGGDLAIRPGDDSGLAVAQTFFEVRAVLRAGDRSHPLSYHGRTGRIRFRVAPEPLWNQASRRIRQLVQRRHS